MRIIAIAKRIFLQNIYDKRTLALMVVAPLIILSLVYALFNTTTSIKPIIGVNNIDIELKEKLEKNETKIIEYSDSNNIKQKMNNDNLAAFIEYKDNNYYITYENFDISTTGKVKAAITTSLQQVNLNMLTKKLNELENKFKRINPYLKIDSKQTKKEVNNDYLYLNKDADYFDVISPILTAFFVFFFVFLIAGISLLNERTTGTLERILATPLKRFELVFGYFIGYGIFAIIQTIIIALFAVYILNMPLVGSIWLVILVNVLVAFVALSLGLLLSSFAKSEFQIMQFIPIIIIPQIFFSGIIDINSMADWLQKLAHIFPLYYAGTTLQDIMIKGTTINLIIPSLLILLLFIVIFTFLNILVLKKYRNT